MDKAHWILVIGWSLFGLVHSIMATEWFKAFCRRLMDASFKYYRQLYSMLALLSMCAVLYWQFSIKSRPIGSFPVLKYLMGLPLGISGLLLMGVSIRRYFFHLSGLSVFFNRQEEAELEIGGMHRFVRHPLYLGTLLFIWSLLLFFPLLSNLLACILITGYTLVGIQLEEQKLLHVYGDAYAEYRRKVPMLVPGIRIL